MFNCIMKIQLNRVLLISAFFAAAASAIYYFRYEKPAFQNILVVGWDGTSRDKLEGLLKEGRLPVLQSIINEGSFVPIEITQGATVTKPGWAQIFTGYSTHVFRIKNNKFYGPIPHGQTIFEKLKEHFGAEKISTIFVSGKEANVGARGPHKICTNCIPRDAKSREFTDWYDESTTAPTGDKKPRNFVERAGEPFFHAAKTMNHFQDRLGNGENLMKLAIEKLDTIKDKKFFAFVHFRDPDELGHVYGEASKEYIDGIVQDDIYLGRLLEYLKTNNLIENTLVFIVSDHGMDPNSNEHFKAHSTFLVTNVKNLSKQGDRLDIAPTFYDLYGFKPENFEPKLNGKSLLPRSLFTGHARSFE